MDNEGANDNTTIGVFVKQIGDGQITKKSLFRALKMYFVKYFILSAIVSKFQQSENIFHCAFKLKQNIGDDNTDFTLKANEMTFECSYYLLSDFWVAKKKMLLMDRGSFLFTKMGLKNQNYLNGDIRELEFEQFKNEMIKYNPRDVLIYGDKIFNNFREFCMVKDDKSIFEFVFPQHLLDVISSNGEDQKRIETVNLIKHWFDNHCKINKERKKALLLYSRKRGLGKTCFAKSLAGSIDDQIIYCRSLLSGKEFENKRNGKIIVLDDVKFGFDQIETLKALTSSEETDIRSTYVQHRYKGGLPCVILTNEISTFDFFWSKTWLFKSQMYFVIIDFYLGPPNTEPISFNEIQTNMEYFDEIKFNLN